jgi:hypothetical protein
MSRPGWTFLGCLGRAIEGAQHTLATVLTKARFWQAIADVTLNDRELRIKVSIHEERVYFLSRKRLYRGGCLSVNGSHDPQLFETLKDGVDDGRICADYDGLKLARVIHSLLNSFGNNR